MPFRLNGTGKLFAETRGFEPPNPFLGYLISSEAHSTGLCDVSEYLESLQAIVGVKPQKFSPLPSITECVP